MTQYINKGALVAKIERRIKQFVKENNTLLKNSDNAKELRSRIIMCKEILSFINTLEVNDPYEQCVQYSSIKDGIEAHAETYSFNIESELFQQLTKEQQKLWRKEIEQAVISGGEMGVELAKDPRYKENLEVKEIDLEKELRDFVVGDIDDYDMGIAKYFYELGLKAAQKGE